MPTKIGEMVHMCLDGHDGDIDDRLDELWKTGLFKRCDPTTYEVFGDYAVRKFAVWISSDRDENSALRTKARIGVLSKLGFKFVSGKENNNGRV